MAHEPLKQIVLISEEAKEKYTEKELMQWAMKAPMKLLTRAFKTSEAFVGRDESKHFHGVITEWIDNQDCNMQLKKTLTADESETMLYTAELMGIPSAHLCDKDGFVVCTVLGPADQELLEDITEPCDDF